MSQGINKQRRWFLQGHNRMPEVVLQRPPWWRSESLTQHACRECNLCVSSCPEKIIAKDEFGLPIVDFSASGCNYCDACASACPSEYFLEKTLRTTDQAWQQHAVLNSQCLSHRDVVCQSCQDICDVDAIGFIYRDRIPRPVVRTDNCNGCGYCLSVCPTTAIDIVSSEEARKDNEHV